MKSKTRRWKTRKQTIYILSLLLILTIGVFGFFLYRSTIFSKQVLKLEILGPENAKMADEVEYTVKYKNNGNFALENPKLIFELPENSLTEDSKIRFTQNLDDVYPGDEKFIKFKGRLLGKEGDLKTAKTSLSYTPHNLSARYESDTTFTTKIESVPINLNFDLPSKIEKGKEINYSLNYFSNVDYPLENLSVKIENIKGFDFKSSDPVSLDNSEWKLNTLNKTQGGKLKITGIISADSDQILNFTARLGMWQDGRFIVIKEASQEVQVIQPLLFISQQINGISNYVASLGQTLNYEVFFRNIGSTSFDNLFVISRLEGLAFDLLTLRSLQGQIKPNDNLIIFDPKQISELRRLKPQQEVRVSFSVKLKENNELSDLLKNNLVVKNKVNVLDISEEFVTKVGSELELFQKIYHQSFDGIENSGPTPPKVGEATTYVVNWQVKNYSNDVKNLKVKAILPESVFLSDAISPENQASNFSYDSQSKEIIWLAGSLAPGFSTSVSFQVALIPNSSQIGKTVDLIGPAAVLGEDQFTGSTVQGAAPAINTSLPDDPANAGGVVQ